MTLRYYREVLRAVGSLKIIDVGARVFFYPNGVELFREVLRELRLSCALRPENNDFFYFQIQYVCAAAMLRNIHTDHEFPYQYRQTHKQRKPAKSCSEPDRGDRSL